MKLQELISPRPYIRDAETRVSIGDRLRSLGFKKIGERSKYAGIYEHPNLSYVVKVFDANDIGYKSFLKVALKHQDNPHFPRFRGKPVALRDTPVMAIRMEKLTPVSTTLFNELESVLRQADILGWEKYALKIKGVPYILKKYPQFASALNLLIPIKKKYRYMMWDWHKGNIMMRGDCPVIIDPFVDYEP